jgi:hypothetical protein
MVSKKLALLVGIVASGVLLWYLPGQAMNVCAGTVLH